MKSLIKSKKMGVLVSYFMIACNTISSIVLVPFYLKFLGVDGYGFYQMIYSVANYILILDFGIGTTMVRYIAEYRARKDEKAVQNFSAHCGILVIFISILILIIGVCVCSVLGDIYPILTEEKVLLGQKMFMYMLIVLVMTIVEHYMEGIAMACDSFSVAKLIGSGKLILKFVLVLMFLYGGNGVLSLVYVDIIALLVALVLYGLYVFKYLKFKIYLYHLDMKLFSTMATFMVAIMLQSVVAYINNTVDKTILGIMLGETASGIYGLSMTFITMFNMIPTSILTIFLPQATKMVVEGCKMEQHTALAIKLGRYQMIMCGGIISAFTILGVDFIRLWVGTNESIVWKMALIIMIPNGIPLIQNYCLNILDAMNKRMFRSVTLLGLSIVNVILTILFVGKWGVIGAPIATAIAYIIGHGVVMNFYYHKCIKINVLKMWKGINHRLLISIVLTTVLTIPLKFFTGVTLIIFIMKCIVWCIVYGIVLLVVGLNTEEKIVLKDIGQRIRRRFTHEG